jgi:hypothetical protein
MTLARIVAVACALGAPAVVIAVGCDRDDDTPVAPTPPPPPPPPPPTVELKPPEEPDAGADAAEDADAGSDAGKKGGSFDPTGIAACCVALRTNPVPLDQKGLFLSAAAACDAIRNSPQGRAALGQIRAMLGAANVPAACR